MRDAAAFDAIWGSSESLYATLKFSPGEDSPETRLPVNDTTLLPLSGIKVIGVVAQGGPRTYLVKVVLARESSCHPSGEAKRS